MDESLPLDARLDALVPALLAEHKVPGAALVFLAPDRTLVRGYGLRRAGGGEPVGPETLFEAASLGKPLFAYVMMQRVLDGALDLDRPLAIGLERLPSEDEALFRQITARHVLSHTTGLPNWRPKHFTPEPEPLRVHRVPGSAYGYSGEGFMYLQRVSEGRLGESMESIVQRSLLAPLGMATTSYTWAEAFESDHALPHDDKGEPGQPRRLHKVGVAYSLHSTASDLARFLERMLAEADPVAEAMLAPQVEIEGRLAWSLGWGLERRDDGDWFWQWGDNSGFKHVVYGSRSRRRAVLVLTNGDKGANVHSVVVETLLGFRPEALDFRMIRY